MKKRIFKTSSKEVWAEFGKLILLLSLFTALAGYARVGNYLGYSQIGILTDGLGVLVLIFHLVRQAKLRKSVFSDTEEYAYLSVSTCLLLIGFTLQFLGTFLD